MIAVKPFHQLVTFPHSLNPYRGEFITEIPCQQRRMVLYIPYGITNPFLFGFLVDNLGGTRIEPQIDTLD